MVEFFLLDQFVACGAIRFLVFRAHLLLVDPVLSIGPRVCASVKTTFSEHNLLFFHIVDQVVGREFLFILSYKFL